MPARPDILWIVTTQWRGQAGGFAGDPNVRTPALDAFARTGVVFDRAFSNHPFGPFARALLLTGRLSPDNGVSDYWDPLPRGAVTIAHRLAAAGYATAFFGKWHLSRRDPAAPVVGEAHARQVVASEDRGGFAFWEGFESGFLLNDPWLHGTRLPVPTRFPGYQADVLCARAAEWLNPLSFPPSAAARPPRFTVVSLEAPHPPYGVATPPDVAPYDPAELVLAPAVPRGGEVEATVRRELAGYYRHIEATDRAIGRLLAAIDRSTTAVFITSAHGDMHGAHGLFRKGWPYEESIRVPLLVSWPGATPAQIGTPVSLADLPATALALASAAIPGDWTGADLRALAPDADRAIPLGMPSAPPFEKQCPHPWTGVRTRDELRTFTADGRPWLRFDLRADPSQCRNLASG
jgi:arylsulfatase A-like enzyme